MKPIGSPRRPLAPDEPNRVIAGYARLRREAVKAAAHIDVSNLRDSAQKPWSKITPREAANRLDDPRFLEEMRKPLADSPAFQAKPQPEPEPQPPRGL